MVHKASTLISISCIIVCVLLELTLSYPYGLSLLTDSLPTQQDDLSPAEWNTIRSAEVPSKRDCAGFPCMYTHMAEKAGRASLYRTLARIIDACAVDPSCNPGRRRRRSIRSLSDN